MTRPGKEISMQTKSIKAQANQVMMICHLILNGVLFIAYVGEYLKGAKTLGFTLMFSAITIIPAVIDVILYRNDPDNNIMKHFIPISFAVLNTVAMFTSESKLTFTYAICILVCMMLYLDPPYFARTAILTVLVNGIDVVYKFMTGALTAADSADVEIRIALLIVLCIFIYIITKKINDMNNEKQAAILGEKEKTEAMLKEIIDLSNEMTGAITEVNTNMSTLAESTHTMEIAMDEVSQGNHETADSIQSQVIHTDEIQNMIDTIRGIGEDIATGMDTALTEVNAGHDNMEVLSKLAEKSDQANETVVSLVNELRDQTKKMNDIIVMITSIANSTGMLALNASIEAARAGEAGKGFAVVATQVSELADQTKGASANITELIRDVVKELDNVVEAVGVLKESTGEEDVKITELKGNLDAITDKTREAASQTQEMKDMVARLAKANEEIVNQIQTISAVTEEVTARSEQTLDACSENTKIVDAVTKLAESLNKDAMALASRAN